MDFPTLYIVIFLNALALCGIWGAIAFTYRDLTAARYWLASSALAVGSGTVLSLDGGSGSFLPTILANALALLGLFSVWMGARVFHRKPPGWRTALIIIALCVAAMALTFHTWWGRNPFFTGSQALPMAMTAVLLLRKRPFSLGATMSAVALLIGAAANGAVAGANASLLTDWPLNQNTVAHLASLNLALLIFSMVVSNFGLVVMTVDRLRGELTELAAQDPLTGLRNRRFLMEHLHTALRHARQTGTPLGLMILDLDRFKPINDGFGHAAGDACLVHVANVIKQRLRPGDVFARFGGDEFCILLPECSAEDATLLASDIVRAVPAARFTWRDRHFTLGLSIGIAITEPNSDRIVESLFEDADAALYDAKMRGRGRISLYSPDIALKSA
ncbi:diguanylate cyclase domain-containing protein [Terrihabitans sp. B22-R8]|uniref:diguanylate cyclase domain-containing protein n=1 Tax=Terrihabitans sp. B22-R8 TaxID=3425128 RepID=UPI00403C39A4